MRGTGMKTFASLCIALAAGGIGAQTTGPTADGAWERVNEVVAGDDGPLGSWVMNERQRRRYRERGLQYWFRFPDDARRWQWLQYTVMTPPWYWSDPEQGARAFAAGLPEDAVVDRAAKEQWERNYLALRTALLSTPEVSERRGFPMVFAELSSRIRDADLARRRGEPADLAGLAREVSGFLVRVAGYDSRSNTGFGERLGTQMSNLLFHDPALERAFIDAMKAVPDERLMRTARLREDIAALRSTAPADRLRGLDGQAIDLAGLRGKVVLIDIWSLGCSGCVKSLPQVQALYQRYRGQGFEAVGLCFNDPADKGKVDALTAKLQLTWPQSLQGAQGTDPIARLFKPWVAPYLLFDRRGLLVGLYDHLGTAERALRLLLDASADVER